MEHTTSATDPLWGDVATAIVLVLLALSVVAITVIVATEHRRTRARRNDPLGIARTLDEYRDRRAARR